MRKIGSVGVIGLFILGWSNMASAADKVTLNLNWFYVGDHSPYFVALDKGWYKEEGLEPTILTGKGSGDVVKRVDIGSADIGIVDTGVLIVARAQGAKVKIVSMLFDKSPYCMWMWKDSGINSPKDLVGKKIGAPPGDAQRTIFPALAQANGFDPDKVTFVNIAAEAKFSALAAKQVDVIFDYYSGAPFFHKAMGEGNVKYMMFADYGVDVYSNALVASEKYIKENPGIIKRFVKASLRGWEFALKNPEESIEIMAKHRPEIDKPVLLANLKLIIDLFRTHRYKQNGIGWVDEKKMADSIRIISQYRDLQVNMKPGDIYTNEFLTKIPLPIVVK
ncbi:MAG TPA: ABC transporter substrate-binding protein [Thermodesulfobacteriota bacterium]|nr:ABC transporter substrate-binding protein [Thermodesulfobacteriota bacterium]